MPLGETSRPREPRRSGGGGGARVDQRTRAARAQGREARDELLAAALRVFARRGYREAGVDEIAAAAGYSKGALYWHFSGKEELLMALIEERIDAPTREMVALLESSPPDRDMAAEAPADLRVAAHVVDRGDGEVPAHLHLEFAAVGLADVRLVRGARVDVGLHSLDGPGDLGQRGGANLRRGVARQQGLGAAVDG